MGDPTGRALRLLGLMQSRSGWGGAELAARLGVTERSVRRDVERLRRLGYPVHASRGAGGGYRLGAGRSLPPLLLDPEEAVAVAVSLHLAAGGTVSGVGEAALRALTKIDQVLPAGLREQVDAVHDATVAVPQAGAAVAADDLLTLARGCRDQTEVRFAYLPRREAAADEPAQHDDREPAPRRVHPYRLVARGQRWYLLGFDRDRDDWRTFRLDRMSQVRSTTWTFVPRPDVPDPADYVTRAVTQRPYRLVTRLRFTAPAAEVAERIPVAAGEIIDRGDQGCDLVTGAMDLRWAAVHLLTIDLPFQVIEPPELRDELARVAQLASEASDSTVASV